MQDIECFHHSRKFSSYTFPVTIPFPNLKQHQIINTKIRLIILFAAKDGDALYNQQKQDQELTVAQTVNSLLQNSDLN